MKKRTGHCRMNLKMLYGQPYGKEFMKNKVREQENGTAGEEAAKKGRMDEMLIGRIYDKVFVPMNEEAESADEALNEKLLLLVAGADMEHMDDTQLADLICKGTVIGQREGFISGVRFTARLFCDMLS